MGEASGTLPARPDVVVSVVCPAFNEAESIGAFHSRLTSALGSCDGYRFAVVYVDDGSDDQTLSMLRRIAADDPRVSVLALSKNFGKEYATTAGINQATGEATLVLDSDGQHPPELIPRFLEEWRKGAQVVVGVRKENQGEGLVRKIGSKGFYRLMSSLAGDQLVTRGTDYQLIDREVREEFNRFTEHNRMTRGLIQWLGFDRAEIQFVADERIGGKPAYSLGGLVRLAVDSVISSSLRPLYLSVMIGSALATLALLLGLFVLIEQVFMGDPLGLRITGAAMLGMLVLFLSGLILTAQGITALYLAAIHREALGRPLYVVNRRRSILRPTATRPPDSGDVTDGC